jgi:hypothetical protein
MRATKLDNAKASQECVGKVKSYADDVQGRDIQSLNVTDAIRKSTTLILYTIYE